jgi:hypothetical protein
MLDYCIYVSQLDSTGHVQVYKKGKITHSSRLYNRNRHGALGESCTLSPQIQPAV